MRKRNYRSQLLERKKVFLRLTNIQRQTVSNLKTRYGSAVSNATAYYLAKTKGASVSVVQKVYPQIQRALRYVRNHKERERVVKALLILGGTSYAVYNNKEKLVGYASQKLINQMLERTYISTREGHQPVKLIWKDLGRRYTPYISQTDIFEDPAKVLMVVVVTRSKKQLINDIRIIPDGRGGARTIKQTITQAKGANEALKVLQVANSFEKTAVEVVESGGLGSEAATFAVSYRQMDQVIADRTTNK